MMGSAIWINAALVVLISLVIIYFAEIKGWRKSLSMYIFANRNVQIVEGVGAICVHWIWAPALFISPAIAYNYGWKGLLYFCIPNGLSVIIAGYLAHNLRKREESSLTNLVEERSVTLAVTMRIMFAIVSFAALVLAFTATAKLWKYTGTTSISAEVITAIAAALAFIYTVLGGLRTSIFTGFVIFLGWLAFIVAIMLSMGWYNLPLSTLLLPGIKADGFTNELFMASFGAAFLPLILVGASGHGMMWQKSMSMKQENILPAFTVAGISFMFIIFIYGLSAITAISVAPSLMITQPERAALFGINQLLGSIGLGAFITLFLWQTLTVMDSALNYLCYVVSEDIMRAKEMREARYPMSGIIGLFIMLAWLTATMKWEIWPLFLIMSVIRTSCFSTMWNVAKGINFNHNAAIIGIILGGGIATALAFYNKYYSVPWLDFWAITIALVIPWISTKSAKIVDKLNKTVDDIFDGWAK